MEMKTFVMESHTNGWWFQVGFGSKTRSLVYRLLLTNSQCLIVSTIPRKTVFRCLCCISAEKNWQLKNLLQNLLQLQKKKTILRNCI